MTGSHLPLDYRGEFEHRENRFGSPGQVCDTCSNFEQGLLVPVSFCPPAQAAQADYDRWLCDQGDRPVWLDSADAMIVRF